MPATLSEIQREILAFIVEMYDQGIHGPLNVHLIISETDFAPHVVANSLSEMKKRGLIKAVSPGNIYTATQEGRALIQN